jgi:dipeptidyl aminopeptidase/acylaminoacyl peptidase
MPRATASGTPRFAAEANDEDRTVSRGSGKLPVILTLVIGGVIALFVGLGLLVSLGMYLWLRVATPKPIAMSQPAVNEINDPMPMVQHGQWEQAPGQMGGPGILDPNNPMGIRDVSGPDEKGRVSFLTSRQVVAVTFLDAGKTLAAASSDGEVRLWDLDPPKLKSVIPPGRRDGITDMAFAPDGKTFVTVNHGGAVQIMDVTTKQEKAVLSGSEPTGTSLWAVAYSPTGITIATAHGNNVVKLWDVKKEKLGATLDKHKGQVSSLAFSRDGALLASGGWDATVIVWKVAEHQVQNTIKPPSAPPTSFTALAFSPDSNLLAFGGGDNQIHLWDLAKNEERAACRHLKDVTSVVFTQDGRLFASSSSDSTIRLWDGVTGERRALLQTDTGSNIRGLAFSPDGKKLAVGVNGVQLWDLSKVEMLKGP